MHEILLMRVGQAEVAGTTRVLVDRLWPRGISRERADWHEWLKDAAPSHELRKRYCHDPARRGEFERLYLAELEDESHRGAVERLLQTASEGPLTLLTFTRNVESSQLPVLREFLLERLGSK